MSVELNMWHQVGIATALFLPLFGRSLGDPLGLPVGINRLHSLAYVSWTSNVLPDHDHFLRDTTLQSDDRAGSSLFRPPFFCRMIQTLRIGFASFDASFHRTDFSAFYKFPEVYPRGGTQDYCQAFAYGPFQLCFGLRNWLGFKLDFSVGSFLDGILESSCVWSHGWRQLSGMQSYAGGIPCGIATVCHRMHSMFLAKLRGCEACASREAAVYCMVVVGNVVAGNMVVRKHIVKSGVCCGKLKFADGVIIGDGELELLDGEVHCS
nr:hypothetical protein [Tanacetum cinerariifolium]